MIQVDYLLIVHIRIPGPQGTVLIVELIYHFGRVGGQIISMVKHQKLGLLLVFMIVMVNDQMMVAGSLLLGGIFLIWMFIWNLMIDGLMLETE